MNAWPKELESLDSSSRGRINVTSGHLEIIDHLKASDDRRKSIIGPGNQERPNHGC